MTSKTGTRKMCGSERLRAARLRDKARWRQRNRCFYCKEQMTAPDSNRDKACTAEHVIPVRDGGRTTPTNIVAACADCNHKRSHPAHDLLKQQPAKAGALGDVWPCPA